jgi:hypothetical protein
LSRFDKARRDNDANVWLMNARAVPIAAWGVFAVVALGSGAVAQTGTPRPAAPSPSPTPLAFTARAHADITVVATDRTITGSAVLGMSQRANLTRVDIISVKTDAIPLPPISGTFVIDRSARTVTAWSGVTKRYYVSRMSPSPSPGPTPTPQGLFVGTSFLAGLDVMDVSLKLTGHTTTAGIATSGLAIDAHFAKKGSLQVVHATATTQLADEYGAFPMTIDATLDRGGSQSLKVSYAVDELTRALPAAAGFHVPAGYTKATSMMGVIFSSGTPTVQPSLH